MGRRLSQFLLIGGTLILMLLYQNCGGLESVNEGLSSENPEGGEIPEASMADLQVVKQPFSKSGLEGDTIAFEVVADTNSGSPLSYQWKKNGENLEGETGAKLILSDIEFDDTGLFSVEVSTTVNVGDTGLINQVIETSAAPLVVTSTTEDELIPQRVRQSQSHALNSDEDIVLQVDYYGKPQPSIQWFKDEVAIDGATDSHLIVRNSQPSDTGTYYVEVTNQVGTSWSDAILILVDQDSAPPEIQFKTRDSSIGLGQSLTLVVSTVGLPAPSHQWMKDGVAIPGAIGKTYRINDAALTHAGTYSILVTNQDGAVTENIEVTVVDNVTIDTPLVDQTVSAGQPVTFTVLASGEIDSYQWFKDDIAISGATTDTLSIASVASSDSGVYKVQVGNISGVVESSATLTVVSSPQIAAAPMDVTVNEGEMASFSVSASGTALQFQWSKDGTPIGGATASSLNIPMAQLADAGTYSVEVSNIAGAVSVSAILTVNQLVVDGAAIYGNTCAACHGELSVSVKKMRTAAQIQSAIATIPAMMGISLNSVELAALEQALDIP